MYTFGRDMLQRYLPHDVSPQVLRPLQTEADPILHTPQELKLTGILPGSALERTQLGMHDLDHISANTPLENLDKAYLLPHVYPDGQVDKS